MYRLVILGQLTHILCIWPLDATWPCPRCALPGSEVTANPSSFSHGVRSLADDIRSSV